MVFTDRKDVPDIKTIQGTILIYQVNGTKNTGIPSLVWAVRRNATPAAAAGPRSIWKMNSKFRCYVRERVTTVGTDVEETDHGAIQPAPIAPPHPPPIAPTHPSLIPTLTLAQILVAAGTDSNSDIDNNNTSRNEEV